MSGKVICTAMLLLMSFAFACCSGSVVPTPGPTATPSPTPTPLPTPTPTPDPALLIAEGERLAEVHECFGCHSTDGRTFTGPTWKGLYGKIEEFEDGTSMAVDEEYIRQSILEPDAKIVKEFYDLMPTKELDGQEIDALIAYIKSLEQ